MFKKLTSFWEVMKTAGVQASWVVVLFMLILLATVTEIFGVGMFLPIMQYIRLEGNLEMLIQESPNTGRVIKWIQNSGITFSLASLLGITFGLFLLRQVFSYARLHFSAKIRTELIRKKREEVFRLYLGSRAEYYDQTPAGSLLATVATEIPNAAVGVLAPIEFGLHLVLFCAYLVFLTVLSWKVTLGAVLILLIAMVIPHYWSRLGRTIGKRVTRENVAMSEFLMGRLRSPRLVKLSGTEDAESVIFRKITERQRQANFQSALLRSGIEVAIEPIVVGLSLIFIFFAYTALQWPVEAVGIYLVVILRLMPLLKGGLASWFSLQNAAGAIENVTHRIESLRSQQEVKEVEDPNSKKLQGDIIFDRVSYQYTEASVPALNDVSFVIKWGSVNVIAGPSGSGKSTIVDLIPKYRKPSSGAITIDGVNISDLPLTRVRGSVAFAPQDPQIFPGRIEEHIQYGKADASPREIVTSAQNARADKFIRQLPDQYKTYVGDDGTRLSGGQRQRLDLARALIKDASWLILDEPTSNLDPATEAEFFKTLQRYQADSGKTVVLISHSIRNFKDVDHIIIVVDGKVEFSGDHRQQLEYSGWYSKALSQDNIK